MNNLERLIAHADKLGLYVYECNLHGGQLGLIDGENILIERNLTINQRYSVLSHEITHFYISPNKNTLDKNITNNRKYEREAETHAFLYFLPFKNIRAYIYNNPYCNVQDLAGHFNVDVGYLVSALNYYESKFGSIEFRKMIRGNYFAEEKNQNQIKR